MVDTANFNLRPALARQFSQMMDEEGVSLADLLAELAEERKKSYGIPIQTPAQFIQDICAIIDLGL